MPEPIENEEIEVNDPAQENDPNGNAEQVEEGNVENVEGSEETDPKKSRGEVRHERYIEKLNKEIRLGSETSRYEDDLFTPQKPYEPLSLKEGEEYDPKQLEDDRNNLANNKFAEGFARGSALSTTQANLEKFNTNLDIDSDRVAAKWAVLDPESEDYDSKLEENLVKKYVAFTGLEKDPKGRLLIQRPNVRFKDFVDAEMLDREEYATNRGAQSSTNIRKQAAHTTVRPSGQTRVAAKGHGFDGSSPDAAARSVQAMTSEQYHKLGGKEASDAYLAARGLGPKS